jgi:hypothetical protein
VACEWGGTGERQGRNQAWSLDPRNPGDKNRVPGPGFWVQTLHLAGSGTPEDDMWPAWEGVRGHQGSEHICVAHSSRLAS